MYTAITYSVEGHHLFLELERSTNAITRDARKNMRVASTASKITRQNRTRRKSKRTCRTACATPKKSHKVGGDALPGGILAPKTELRAAIGALGDPLAASVRPRSDFPLFYLGPLWEAILEPGPPLLAPKPAKKRTPNPDLKNNSKQIRNWRRPDPGKP